MNYKNLSIKSSYETGEDEILDMFYIPVLENAVKYDRIAGFFSSSSLAIAARGISGLIKNSGRMRIIACPKLNKLDINIINEVYNGDTRYLEENLINSIDEIEDAFENNHVKALGWMLSHGLLEIKIAIPRSRNRYFSNNSSDNNKGIFHQKVGLLKDTDGNEISFSGSINETGAAWIDNIEEFKVFKSWVEEQKNYLDTDIRKFEEFWKNERSNVDVISLPQSVKKKMIESSNDFDLRSIEIGKYKKYRSLKKVDNKLSLFYYQKNAIKIWKENNKNLLFQMATGTGKTRTAIGCMVETMINSDKLLIIVSCPQGTLSHQWKEEIEELGIKVDYSCIIDGTNKNWKNNLIESILKLSIDYYKTCILYTTHTTGSKDYFTSTIKTHYKNFKILFIGDEVHGLGATQMRKGLLEEYEYRVGLSATPTRWFDEEGSDFLENYFGNEKFEFSISDALRVINPVTGKPFLVNYYYNIEFIQLEDEEVLQYKKLSNDIRKLKLCKRKSNEYEERIERLLFKRASIVKNANKKMDKLEEILSSIENIEDMIIFVSSEQITGVLELLANLKIAASKVTQEEGTIPEKQYNGLTERQYIIEKFKQKKIKVLVAIKCLDEGIDIPSASSAILMSNTTNPREYVQRIGRVIRQSKNKSTATIYDISIEPCYNRIEDENIKQFEKSICKKEKVRLEYIAKDAINNAKVLNLIEEVMGE